MEEEIDILQTNPKMYNFFKEIYKDNNYRIVGKRDINEDIELYKKNEALIQEEIKLIKHYYSEDYPIVFIQSVPRSGSTFLSQFIADNFDIGYINNFVATYFLAPIYGQIEFEKNQKKQSQNIDYQSFLGKTRGYNSPHEFGYFWQYWLNHTNHDHLTANELEQKDWKNIKEELYGLAGYCKKPLIIKNVVYNIYNTDFLYNIFPNAKFLYIKRKPEYTIQSLYESRIARYGSEKIWFSTRPKQVERLQMLTPIEQVVEQYFDIEQHLDKAFEKLGEKDKLILTYEKLVKEPKVIANLISTFIGLKHNFIASDKIKLNNNKRLSDNLFDEISKLIGKRKK